MAQQTGASGAGGRTFRERCAGYRGLTLFWAVSILEFRGAVIAADAPRGPSVDALRVSLVFASAMTLFLASAVGATRAQRRRDLPATGARCALGAGLVLLAGADLWPEGVILIGALEAGAVLSGLSYGALGLAPATKVPDAPRTTIAADATCPPPPIAPPTVPAPTTLYVPAARGILDPTPRPDEDDALTTACSLMACDYGLTPREADVLPYLARGRSARVIAESLFISEATVRTHTRRILEKTDLHSKQEVIDLVARY